MNSTDIGRSNQVKENTPRRKAPARRSTSPSASASSPRPARRNVLRPGLEAMEPRQLLAAVLVNSPLDTVVAGDGIVTLREAILATNTANAGADADLVPGSAFVTGNYNTGTASANDVINFNIPGNGPFTIQPTNVAGALPTIIDPVTIDGYSQPGSAPNTLDVGNNSIHSIVINGNNLNLPAGTPNNGLVVNTSNSVIQGLVINGFDNDNFNNFGILITAGGGRDANNNRIVGNFIGTDPTGVIAIPNEQGIAVRSITTGFGAAGAATNNLIGDVGAANRNVISGNQASQVAPPPTNRAAVQIGSPGGGTVTGTVIVNNYVGLAADGLTALGNSFSGVRVQSNAVGTTIGGGTAATRNVISANQKGAVNQTGIANGIEITDATTTTTVIGNYIGTNANGLINIATGNQDNGILVNLLTGAPTNNTIGGVTPGSGNLIAGNNGAGVFLNGAGVNNNLIQGNEIRLNTFRGIRIAAGASSNTIGGGLPGAGNIIADNGLQGINIEDLSFNNLISQNSIFNNADIGIDLIGAGNNAQVAPILDPNPTLTAGGLVRVTGTYAGPVPALLEFFTNLVADPSGAGEGQTFVGNLALAVAGAFTVDLPIDPTSPFRIISATATNTTSSETSEFSNNITLPVTAQIDNAVPQVEGDPNSAATKLSFTVRLNTPNHGGVTLNYSTQLATIIPPALYGVATNSVDYLNTSGTLTFAPGENVKTIQVDVVGDLTAELDELVSVQLFDPSPNVIVLQADGKTPEPDQRTEAYGVILDDDVTFSVNDVTAGEATTPFAFTVTANGPHTRPVTVSYLTADGTAVAGQDYTAIPLTALAVFAPTDAVSATATVNVAVTDDQIPEAVETFFLNLINPIYAAVAAVTVPITLDPIDPNLDVVTTDTTFPALQQNNAKLAANAQGIGTIVDNDSRDVGITITDVTRTEGPNALMEFEVTLTQPSAQTVTVDYVTANGTATTPQDYIGLPTTTLTFLPGETVKRVTVTLVDDNIAEPTENFFVNLSNPSVGAQLVKTQGVGTILDNDAIAVLVADNLVIPENIAGGLATFRLRLVSPNNGQPVTAPFDMTVQYTTAPGTATPGPQSEFLPNGTVDYASRAGTATIAAGQSETIVTVPINDDTLDELDETFFLKLSGLVGPAVLSATEVQATIIDNEQLPNGAIGPDITVGPDVIVAEPVGPGDQTSAVFAVRLSGPSGKFVTVNYVTGDGSATSNLDYQSTFGSVTFAPGEVFKEVRVPILRDLARNEADENFTLTLSNPTNAVLTDAVGVATILDTSGPQVIDVQRLGYHYGATSVVITYDEPMDPDSATNVNNYRLKNAGKDGKFGTYDDQEYQIRSAVLSADGTKVTLNPVNQIKLGLEIELTINGTEPLGVRDAVGNLIDGNKDGATGGNYVTKFNKTAGLRDLRRGTAGLGVPPVNPRPFGKPPMIRGVKIAKR